MEKSDLEVLSNEKIPEAVRAAIAQSLLGGEAAKADRGLEQVRLELERKKFLWSTPLVAAATGLITLSATFIFDRISSRDDTLIAISLEDFRQELKESEARLKQQLDTETTKTVAQIEALAGERQFQYEIVRSELTNADKSNADRAAILLFLVRAGILNALNREELEAMAVEQIENPEKNIIPQLVSSEAYKGGIVGSDDAVEVSQLPSEHLARDLARSVGLLSTRGIDGAPLVCTAFLVSPMKIATAEHCVDAKSNALFSLGPGPEDVEYSVNLEEAVFFADGTGRGYAIVPLIQAVPDDIRPLKISDGPVQLGMQLGMVYFRSGAGALAVWGGDDCRVRKIEGREFFHLCDTGAGSSGGPVFDTATNLVVGIHSRRSEFGGVAVEFDRSSPLLLQEAD